MNIPKIKKVKLKLVIQNPENFSPLPLKRVLAQWVGCGLAETLEHAEITIRFVSEQESQSLNTRYRNQAKPTNILSFNYASGAEEDLKHGLMGDLAICWPVVLREACSEKKTIEHHLAHLIIHGILHLQGYDHQTDAEAAIMERKEIALLADLQFPNPYIESQETI